MDISTSIFGLSASSTENDKVKDDGLVVDDTTRIPDAIEFLDDPNPDANNAGNNNDLLNALAVICDDPNSRSMVPVLNHQGLESPLLANDDMPLLGSTAKKRQHPGSTFYHPDSCPSPDDLLTIEQHQQPHRATTLEDSISQQQKLTDTPGSKSGGNKRQRKARCSHPRLTWEERIEQLAAYKREHGDLLIPIRFKDNPSLGKFVHNTREQYKLYQKQQQQKLGGSTGNDSKPTKRCSLTPERIQQLEALGFAWSTERTKHQKEDWEARLQQLRAYKAAHGDCLVPHGYAKDPSFAEWVHRQRTTHAHMLREQADPHAPHHGHNPLVEQRMKQLEELGFHFTVHADKWMEHWGELKAWKEIHGDCLVPTHCPENPKLGRWVHTQRHQRRLQLKGKKSCMTDERVKMLDSLGFSWDVRHLQHQHHQPADNLAADPAAFVPFEAQPDSYLAHADNNVETQQAMFPLPPVDRDCMLQQQQTSSPGTSTNNNGDMFGHGVAMV